MDKKIAREFAVGVILLVVIIVSGIFLFHKARQSKKTLQVTLAVRQEQTAGNSQTDNSCKPRYYQGQAELQGWPTQDVVNDGNEVTVRIMDRDIHSLPVTNPDSLKDFTVKLIDPTEELKGDLRLASKEKPTTIIVHGYAEICQQPPLVSIEQAKVAFKKS